MPQFNPPKRSVLTLALALLLILVASASSRAASPEDEICDVTADQALGVEDYPAAIALHRQFLRTHQNDPLAHYHLGFAYGMAGQTTDEVTEYLAAAKLGLKKWDLFLNLGLAYFDQREWAKAVIALQEAVLLGPGHPEAHLNLAIAYERAEDSNSALHEINAALALAPADPDAHNTKAIVCAERGDLICARNEWTYLIRVNPEYAPARANLASLNRSQSPPLPTTSASKGLDAESLAFAH
jgi:tetratricopeptide (TPR) repeat protein